MSTVISVLAALIVLSIFVVLHELGHYCAGRIFGFGIVEFSVGMGPAIIKKEKKSAIMVTHDLAEAISMSDRVIVLSDRPSTIKNIYEIKLNNKSTPIENRKDKEFSKYYDLIWKDIDYHV